MKYLGLKFGLIIGVLVTYVFTIINLFLNNLSWEIFFIGLAGGILTGSIAGFRMSKSVQQI